MEPRIGSDCRDRPRMTRIYTNWREDFHTEAQRHRVPELRFHGHQIPNHSHPTPNRCHSGVRGPRTIACDWVGWSGGNPVLYKNMVPASKSPFPLTQYSAPSTDCSFAAPPEGSRSVKGSVLPRIMYSLFFVYVQMYPLSVCIL